MADSLHATLTPDGTVAAGTWTVTGAPTHHEAIADPSDLLYIQQIEAGNHLANLGQFSFGDAPAIGAQTRITNVVLRYRLGGTVINEGTLYVYVVTAGGAARGHGIGPMSLSTADTKMEMATDPSGAPWTIDTINGLTLLAYSVNGTIRLFRAYLEVFTNSTAHAIALLPNAPVTDVANAAEPYLEWLYVDDDGEPQEEIHVKLFFDDAVVDDPEAERDRLIAEVVGPHSGGNLVGAGPRPNGDYAWAVRVKEQGSTVWGPWSQRPLYYDLPVPADPVLTATPNATLNRYEITLDSGGGTNPTESFDLQRSEDGGVTWAYVLDGRAIPYFGAVVAHYDYRAPRMARSEVAAVFGALGYNEPVGYSAPLGYNGEVLTPASGPPNVVRYRARAGRTYNGARLVSGWTVITPASLVGDNTTWLKHPTDPAKSITIQHLANWESESEEDMAALRASGRPDWVIFGSVASWERGNIEIVFPGDAAYKAFEALRVPTDTVGTSTSLAYLSPTAYLLQSCFGDTVLEQMWVRLGPTRSVVRVTHSGQHQLQYRRVTVGFHQTKAPA